MNRKKKLSEIQIPEAFLKTTPRHKKMEECRMYWNTYGRQDRYLVVTPNNRLIDGYVQYLVLAENGCDEALVKISTKKKKRWRRISYNEARIKSNNITYRNSETTYVFGRHFQKGNRFSSEFMWRIPNKENVFEWSKDLKPGDVVLVETEHGISPIKITRIEKMNQCPVDMPVKKVVKRVDVIR